MQDEELENLYKIVGGEAKVKEIVEKFYHFMDTEAEFKIIRDMHPKDLSTSIEKLFLFLSGWLGGPPLYYQKYGHPRLRARHLPFPIGEDERNQWIRCMKKALDQSLTDTKLVDELLFKLFQVADFMRNQG